LNLSSGSYNTAVGFFSLTRDSIGGFNTAIGTTGAGALLSNTNGLFNTANGALLSLATRLAVATQQ
jgi:hypothetical protein